MAGMRVVVVATAADGSVDLDDLHAKIAPHAAELAAIMVTYPSTHGVFEDTITEICDVGARGRRSGVRRRREPQRACWASPVRAGSGPTSATSTCTRRSPSRTAAVVPGVGPVAVREHLAPFLPNHPLVDGAGRRPATAGQLRTVRLRGRAADQLGVHRPDGRRRAAAGLADRASSPPTTSRTVSMTPSRCCTRGRPGWSRTSASSTCGTSPRAPASPSTTWPSGSSTTASTPRR